MGGGGLSLFAEDVDSQGIRLGKSRDHGRHPQPPVGGPHGMGEDRLIREGHRKVEKFRILRHPLS